MRSRDVIKCCILIGVLFIAIPQVRAQSGVEISIKEFVKVVDAKVMVLPPVQLNVDERVNVWDKQAVLLPVNINLNENVTVRDTAAIYLPVTLNIDEQVTISDISQSMPGIQRNYDELVSVHDSVQILKPITINVPENVAVNDSTDILKSLMLTVNEQVSINDSTGTAKVQSLHLRWNLTVSDSVEIQVATAIPEQQGSETPDDFRLHANYPNPFNPTTTIRFDLPETAHVTLNIYALDGSKIISLVDKRMSAGSYSVDWDAGQLSSGLYLYQLKAGAYQSTRSMTLLK